MTRRLNYPGALQRLANSILGIQDQVDALRLRASTILVTDTDPDTDDPTNVWLFPDGRLRVRLPDGTIRSIQLNTVAATDTASTVAMPADEAVPKTFQAEYTATWDAVYAGATHGSGVRTGVSTLRWGPADRGAFGNQRAMVGFDATTIAADLAGARVTDVEAFLSVLEAEDPDADLTLGLHNSSAAPATYTQTYRGTARATWTAGVPAWRSVPVFVAESIRDGLASGFTIDVPDTPQSVAYAGSVTSGRPPRLRVTYVR